MHEIVDADDFVGRSRLRRFRASCRPARRGQNDEIRQEFERDVALELIIAPSRRPHSAPAESLDQSVAIETFAMAKSRVGASSHSSPVRLAKKKNLIKHKIKQGAAAPDRRGRFGNRPFGKESSGQTIRRPAASYRRPWNAIRLFFRLLRPRLVITVSFCGDPHRIPSKPIPRFSPKLPIEIPLRIEGGMPVIE